MPTGKVQRYFVHGMMVQLRVFEAVARLGSFTRAGEELHMAQPTVSTHMRKLTEAVGVPLVEHGARGVRLTPAGKAVYGACERVVGVLGDLERSLSDIRGLHAGSLRIATTTAGEYLLPHLLAPFAKRHPGLDISLHVAPRTALLERLADDADDLYLLTDPPRGDEWISYAILPNPLVAFAPAGHPLAGRRNIPFECFAEEPLLVREQGSSTRIAMEEVFSKRGLRPRIRMELGSNQTIREAMIAGLGVALLYRYSLGFDLTERRIVVLDVQGLPHDGHWHFIHSAARALPCAAESFIHFARSEASRIIDHRITQEAACSAPAS